MAKKRKMYQDGGHTGEPTPPVQVWPGHPRWEEYQTYNKSLDAYNKNQALIKDLTGEYGGGEVLPLDEFGSRFKDLGVDTSIYPKGVTGMARINTTDPITGVNPKGRLTMADKGYSYIPVYGQPEGNFTALDESPGETARKAQLSRFKASMPQGTNSFRRDKIYDPATNSNSFIYSPATAPEGDRSGTYITPEQYLPILQQQQQQQAFTAPATPSTTTTRADGGYLDTMYPDGGQLGALANAVNPMVNVNPRAAYDLNRGMGTFNSGAPATSLTGELQFANTGNIQQIPLKESIQQNINPTNQGYAATTSSLIPTSGAIPRVTPMAASFGIGGFLKENAGDLAKTVAGGAMLATGIGAPIGASMLASGVGGVVSNVTNDPTASQVGNIAGQVGGQFMGQQAPATPVQYNMGGQLTEFENGGTHEQNPLGGIPQGPDALVEQGETKLDSKNYIFSDRLKVPGTKRTFAEESKKIKGKYSKRENDPASKKATERELNELMGSQEQLKASKIQNHMNAIGELQGVQMQTGGFLGNPPTPYANAEMLMNQDIAAWNANNPNVNDVGNRESSIPQNYDPLTGQWVNAAPFLDDMQPMTTRATQIPQVDKIPQAAFVPSANNPQITGGDNTGVNPFESSLSPLQKTLPFVTPLASGIAAYASRKDNVDPRTIQARNVDYSNAIGQIQTAGARQGAALQENISNVAPSSGSYLSNIVAGRSNIAQSTGAQAAQIAEQEANANAQIAQQTDTFNTQAQLQADIANAQNKAVRNDMLLSSIDSGVQSGLGIMKDKKAYDSNNLYNQLGLNMMKDVYGSQSFDPQTQTWKYKGQ